MKKNIVLFREKFSHMGRHSGYDLLFRSLFAGHTNNYYSIYRTKFRNPFFKKYIIEKYNGLRAFDINSLLMEYKVLRLSKKQKFDLYHYSNLEQDFSTFNIQQKPPIVATSHQPLNWLINKQINLSTLSQLSGLIVLGKNEENYFKDILPNLNVKFIPHGIATSFFRPNNAMKEASNKLHLLFVGNWLRDFRILKNVISYIQIKKLNIQIHLVTSKENYKIATDGYKNLNNIVHYTNINEERLVDVYNFCGFLFLPLIDGTANNALLEAMSCGLPIATSNLVNTKAYCSNNFTYFFDNSSSAESIIGGILSNFGSIESRIDASLRARAHALQFDWDNIAQMTNKFYKFILDK